MWGISISEALCLLHLTKNIWFSTEDFSICFLPQQYLFYSVISVLLVTLQDSFWVCGEDVEISYVQFVLKQCFLLGVEFDIFKVPTNLKHSVILFVASCSLYYISVTTVIVLPHGTLKNYSVNERALKLLCEPDIKLPDFFLIWMLTVTTSKIW